MVCSSGILEESKQSAVRVAVSHISGLLRSATKKRPLEPPNLVAPQKHSEKTKSQRMVAEELAKILVQRGMENISEYDLKVSTVSLIST